MRTTTNRPWLGSSPGTPSPNRGRKFPAETLTRAEAEALLRQCSQASATGIRNRALLTLLWRCGLRISEALALKPSDIDPGAGTVRVLLGKGRKSRTAGIDDGALAVLQRWRDRRRSLGFRNGPLFCTLAGGPLSDRYVRILIARLANQAGIEKRVTPHTLRHTHASDLVAEGVPVNIISWQLGHANSGITSRYLDHIRPAQVIEAMRRREWKEPE
jgi:site-specific recombinase XerD